MSLQLLLTNAWLRRFMKGRKPAPVEPDKARNRMQAMIRMLPPGPSRTSLHMVPPDPARQLCAATWVQPHLQTVPHTLLYLHGGGYFFGNPAAYRQICCALALRTHARVLVPDYRLAPEHPFPAALQDALAWYRRLLEEGTPAQQIVVVGDSAGGGLTAALLVAARDTGLPQPACAVLFSPWTDLAMTGASVAQCARTDVMFHPQWLHQAAAFYLQGQDARSPLASPLYADLHGLPPLLVFASQHELLRDDATRLADRARRQGVTVHLDLQPGMPHVWPVMTQLPEAKKALAQVAGFVARHACGPSASTR